MIAEPGGLGNEIQRLQSIIVDDRWSPDLKEWAKNQIEGMEKHAESMRELFVKALLSESIP